MAVATPPHGSIHQFWFYLLTFHFLWENVKLSTFFGSSSSGSHGQPRVSYRRFPSRAARSLCLVEELSDSNSSLTLSWEGALQTSFTHDHEVIFYIGNTQLGTGNAKSSEVQPKPPVVKMTVGTGRRLGGHIEEGPTLPHNRLQVVISKRTEGKPPVLRGPRQRLPGKWVRGPARCASVKYDIVIRITQ